MVPGRYINLAGATARRAFMTDQAERLGLLVARFEAVAAESVTMEMAAGLGQSWERPLSAAELACFLSHRALWEQVAAEGRPLMILEDDVVLSRRLAALLPAILSAAPGDLVNLEDFGRRRFVSRTARPVSGEIALRRTFRDKAGAAAYILWPSGARKLLAVARHRAGPADAFLHGAVRLDAWQAEPALAIQAQFLAERGLASPLETRTQIQASRRRLPVTLENRWFLARRLAAQLRLVPEHFRRLGPATFRRVEIEPSDF